MNTVIKRIRRKNSRAKDIFKLAHHVIFVLAVSCFTMCPAVNELAGSALDHHVINSRIAIQKNIAKTDKTSPRLLPEDSCTSSRHGKSLEAGPSNSIFASPPLSLLTVDSILSSIRLIL